MVSGDLAATTIVETLEHDSSAHAGYRARWNAEIGSELRESVAIQRLCFADARRIDAMVDAAGNGSPLVDRVTEWACGAIGYTALRRAVLMRNPAIGIVLGAILFQKKLEATRRAIFQSDSVCPGNRVVRPRAEM